MYFLDSQNAATYLRDRGRLSPDERVEVRELAGGVSNVVLHIRRLDRRDEDFVIKQSRQRLRVSEPWFCSLERIWREVEVLRICDDALRRDWDPSTNDAALLCRAADTPRVLFEDRDDYMFAMTAAPPNHVVWKRMLLAGRADPDIAQACGRLLGRFHAGTWLDADVAARLGDRQLFDQLRIDPYYRRIAVEHADLRTAIDELIDSLSHHLRCLVHADFSPKNLLVHEGGLTMVDFETGHYGDPAFDLGFFLSHMTLKAFFHAPDHARYLALASEFFGAYHQTIAATVPGDEFQALVVRGLQNLAGCLIARLDGKSPIEYLTDAVRRDAVRRAARDIFHQSPDALDAALAICRRQIQSFSQ